jgi:hypothetical protein
MAETNRRMTRTRRLLLILFGCLAGAFQWPAWADGPTRRAEVYFYAPPYRLTDGSVISSPLTVAAEEITTQFPVIAEMDGVVLQLAWSQLCPQRNRCDFSIVDETLRFWGQRGKKVVLGISPAGPPVKTIRDGQPKLMSETPDWALSAVATYEAQSHPIGRIDGGDPVTARFPEYWDERFAPLLIELVQALGRRYDGNPTLSYVRISTGLVGEDEPTPFGTHPERAPGYTFPKWLDYSRRIVDAYRAAFPHSMLEFDISFLPWGYAAGEERDKEATDAFVADLNRSGVFLAFNGLQGDALQWLQHAEIPGFALNRIMHYLAERRHNGLPIGLEAIGPMMVPKMQDIGSMAEIFRVLRPQRLVLFGLDAGSINYVRDGLGPNNSTSVQWMQGRPQSLRELGNLSLQLLDALRRGD